MSPVAAVCPKHGPFESNAFGDSGGSQVLLLGNTTRCPRCGSVAAVMDGYFVFDDDGIPRALSAPTWSLEALRAIQEPLRVATTVLSNPKTSDEQAQRIAERVVEMLSKQDPATAAEVEKKVRGKPALAIAAVFMGMLTVIGHVVNVYDAGEMVADVGTAVSEAFEALREGG